MSNSHTGAVTPAQNLGHSSSSGSNPGKEALADLVKSLPERMRDEIFGLWEEYATASTDEAKFVKALDKLETLIQHNQGLNPPDFDYGFNLAYGANWTDLFEVSVAIRRMVDDETRNNISPDYAL